MQRGELLDRHGVRLVRPSQIGGKVRDRRLQQYPAARLVHLAQALQDLRVVVRRTGFEERAEVGFRLDTARGDERFGAPEQRFLGGVATNHRERSQLAERL